MRDLARHVYDLGPNRASDRFLYPYWGAMFGSGPSMAFRRAALLNVGALDPALGAGSPARAGSDIEAFTAVILHGGRVVHQPRAICWHEHTQDMTYLRGQLFNFAAGLTAISVKYLRDPRFLAAAARSIPYVAGRRRPITRLDPDIVPIPMNSELVRATHTGLFQGPLLYARSRRWARRQHLRDVISGPTP
jgi:cellulose synthase/poly-beta-1,6-N-acetylglucosamine synthase-like glycosyltransferase